MVAAPAERAGKNRTFDLGRRKAGLFRFGTDHGQWRAGKAVTGPLHAVQWHPEGIDMAFSWTSIRPSAQPRIKRWRGFQQLWRKEWSGDTPSNAAL